MDFSDYPQRITRFLNELAIRDNSKSTYRIGLEQFFRWFASTKDRAPQRAHVIAFVNDLRGQRFSSLTINSYLTALKLFFTWAERAHGFANPTVGVRGLKPPKGFRKEALTPDEAAKLVGVIDTTTTVGLRNYAMLNLMLRTGLRCSELIWTDVGDLDAVQSEPVLWVWGKGCEDKDEFVVLTQAALKPITKYLEARGSVEDQDPLFVSHSRHNRGGRLTTQTVRSMAKAALRAIGIDSRRHSTHSLRHSCVTFSLKGGASLQEVQAMARHANISTTLLYAHNIKRIEGAAEKSVDQIFPDL